LPQSIKHREKSAENAAQAHTVFDCAGNIEEPLGYQVKPPPTPIIWIHSAILPANYLKFKKVKTKQ